MQSLGPNKSLMQQWYIKEIDQVPVTMEPKSWITFGHDQFNGFGGCNNFNGTYEISGDSLHFSKIISTRMYCPQQDQEDLLIGKLDGQHFKYEFSAQELRLTSGESNFVLSKSN
jgi:heat shock protein HslJ